MKSPYFLTDWRNFHWNHSNINPLSERQEGRFLNGFTQTLEGQVCRRRVSKWTHQDVGVVLVLLPVQVAACREKERDTNSQRVTRRHATINNNHTRAVNQTNWIATNGGEVVEKLCVNIIRAAPPGWSLARWEKCWTGTGKLQPGGPYAALSSGPLNLKPFLINLIKCFSLPAFSSFSAKAMMKISWRITQL